MSISRAEDADQHIFNDSGGPADSSAALQEQVDALLSTGDTLVCLLDNHAKIVQMNQAFERIFGTDRAVALGRPLADLKLPETAAESLLRDLNAVRATGKPRNGSFSCALSPDVHHFEYRVSISRSDPNAQGLLVIAAHDVTERRRAMTEDQADGIRDAKLLGLENAANMAVMETPSLEELLKNCAQAFVDHLGAGVARIRLVNEDDGVLRLEATAGIDTTINGTPRVLALPKLLERILKERRPLYVNGLTAQKGFSSVEWMQSKGIISFAGLPLAMNAQDTGVFSFYSTNPMAQDLQRAIELVANAISVGIDRRRKEDALRISEQFTQSLADALPQMVWVNLADGRHIYFNSKWREYSGITPNSAIFTEWLQFVHPDDVAPCELRWNQCLKTGEPYEFEHRLRRASDGAYRWHLSRALAVRDQNGEIQQWVGTCTDIEEQKRNELTQRLLVDLSERIRAAQDPSDVLDAAKQVLRDYLRVNQCNFTNISLAAGLAVTDIDFDGSVQAESGQAFAHTFMENAPESFLKGETRVVDNVLEDAQLRRRSPEYLAGHVAAFMSVPLMQEGKLVGALTITSEEPRRWIAQERRLLETVAERTQLGVENVLLLQADRRQRDMLAEAVEQERRRGEELAQSIQETHHRVKNNLQAVSALLELQLDPNSETIATRAVQDSLKQIKAIALVHDLLAQDRPIGDVDVADVLRSLIRLVSAGMSGDAGSTPIALEVEPVLLPTKAATSIALIVNELISNAVKHGGAARREDGSPPINVRLQNRGDEVAILVEDSGAGFPSGFDSKQAAHIGLDLVDTLVRSDLRGHLEYDNRRALNGEPAGARVTVVFPAHSLPA